MDPVELLGTIATVACVVLSVRRSTWQFPVGIVATLLFLVVFWQAQLLASAALQIFFCLVQLYGWWYWLYGDHGHAPRITSWPPVMIGALCLGGVAFAALMSIALARFTNAQMAFGDALIFGLSVVAQFLLDRKKIETWSVWGAVNLLSIWVYATQGLWMITILYVGLFANVFVGHWAWRRAEGRDPVPLAHPT
jgi:nicotinamide mononucleotide transporter